LGSFTAPKEIYLTKSRLEAFSDAVIAIIMTIMVLELRPPSGSTPASLASLAPKFLTYALSFLYLAIYWNNHHHLFQAVERVNGVVLWANIHLIFWLSLVPFVTAWAGDHPTVPLPVAIYGAVLILAAFAYYLLVPALLVLHASDSVLARAIGNDTKGKISLVIYALAILLSMMNTAVAWVLYLAVAAIWLVPDRRIERAIAP